MASSKRPAPTLFTDLYLEGNAKRPLRPVKGCKIGLGELKVLGLTSWIKIYNKEEHNVVGLKADSNGAMALYSCITPNCKWKVRLTRSNEKVEGCSKPYFYHSCWTVTEVNDVHIIGVCCNSGYDSKGKNRTGLTVKELEIYLNLQCRSNVNYNVHQLQDFVTGSGLGVYATRTLQRIRKDLISVDRFSNDPQWDQKFFLLQGYLKRVSEFYPNSVIDLESEVFIPVSDINY
jgi:hypothetical protein